MCSTVVASRTRLLCHIKVNEVKKVQRLTFTFVTCPFLFLQTIVTNNRSDFLFNLLGMLQNMRQGVSVFRGDIQVS